MPSSASRRTDRVAAATGALLLQLGFIAALIHAFSTQTPPRRLERELTFFLPRLLPKPAPVVPAPRAPSAPSAPLRLPIILPPLSTLRPAPPVANAPPVGLENFGRALFDCAPENYTNLTPQQHALCPPPGRGMAIRDAPDPMGLPSQVKDNPRWANAMAHKQSPLLLPGASPDKFEMMLFSTSGPSVVGSIIDGLISDPESWPTYVDPNQFLPTPPWKAGKVPPDQSPGADSK